MYHSFHSMSSVLNFYRRVGLAGVARAGVRHWVSMARLPLHPIVSITRGVRCGRGGKGRLGVSLPPSASLGMYHSFQSLSRVLNLYRRVGLVGVARAGVRHWVSMAHLPLHLIVSITRGVRCGQWGKGRLGVSLPPSASLGTYHSFQSILSFLNF
jgi:hypothetical protein